jgi:hypothetical protein
VAVALLALSGSGSGGEPSAPADQAAAAKIRGRVRRLLPT